MARFECVERIRNNSGNIIKYKIKDKYGNIKDYESIKIKELIKTKKIEINNLFLTKDNRLIFKQKNTFKDKYNLTREKNIFIAKRNLVDYIWKSSNLEGIGATYPQTKAVCEGGKIHGLSADEIIAINNLKKAWQFILQDEVIDSNYAYLCYIHQLVANSLVPKPGFIRKTPVSIGGTKWQPDFPIESQIKEEMSKILEQKNKSITEISIEIMLYIMRKQMFLDGNKRVAMLFANKIMIDNGCGIISISQEYIEKFQKLLIEFYETNNMSKIKQFIYNIGVVSI